MDASNLQVSKSSVNKSVKEATGNILRFQMSEIDNKRDESVLNSCNSHKKIKKFHIPHLPIKVEGGAMGTDENKVERSNIVLQNKPEIRQNFSTIFINNPVAVNGSSNVRDILEILDQRDAKVNFLINETIQQRLPNARSILSFWKCEPGKEHELYKKFGLLRDENMAFVPGKGNGFLISPNGQVWIGFLNKDNGFIATVEAKTASLSNIRYIIENKKKGFCKIKKNTRLIVIIPNPYNIQHPFQLPFNKSELLNPKGGVRLYM